MHSPARTGFSIFLRSNSTAMQRLVLADGFQETEFGVRFR